MLKKYETLLDLLGSCDGVLVAFSGGVDSSLLLHAAHQALGPQAVAGIGRSPSFPESEFDAAMSVATDIGATIAVVEPTEMDNSKYLANSPNRCYWCKSHLFTAMKAKAKELGLSTVVEGSNADDLKDYRPGMKASADLCVRRPLVEVGLTKDEIRELSRIHRLPVWDKPSLACLASRIPYGSQITEDRLKRIDKAEQALRLLGFTQLRVRDHDDVARLEFEVDDLARLLDADLRLQVVSAVKDAGYTFVSLDLEGYRTGAMNEVLTREESH